MSAPETAVSLLLRAAGRQPAPLAGDCAEAACAVGTYSSCFDLLWNLDRWIEWSRAAPRTMVLVCDAPPVAGAHNAHVEAHLTAFDWIAAFALAAAKRGVAPCRVIALDTFSHRFPAAPAVQLFDVMRVETLLTFLTVVPAANLSPLLPALDSDARPASASPEMLGRLLASLVAGPASAAERHSLSNLLGAAMLLRAVRGAGMEDSLDGADRALFRLFAALDLAPDTAPTKHKAPWVAPDAWRGRIQKFVLVDDLADCGWSAFLTSALGLGSGELIVITDPGQASEVIAEQVAWSRIAIFLDLRLFAARSYEEERRFLLSLLDRIEGPGGGQNLCWPDIAYKERQFIRHALDSGGRDTDGYYAALTLFPRLLALQHPHTPIVVFSSTGRREIVERLAPYGTVILDFDKPRFFGSAGEALVEESRVRFNAAVVKAAGIGRTEKLCRDLREYARSAARPKVPDYAHGVVELYIDESTDETSERFAVGGFAIFYPDAAAVEAVSRRLAERGLVWGLSFHDPENAVPPRSYLHKRMRNYEEPLRQFDRLAGEHGCHLMALCLIEREGGRDPGGINLLSSDAMDNRYRAMVNDLIESFLFGILACFPAVPARIRIDVATRLAWLAEVESTAVANAFSLPVRGDSDQYYSLSPEDVYPIVAGILAAYNAQRVAERIDRARGATLTDYDARKEQFDSALRGPRAYRPSPLHYLADWIARFAAKGNPPGAAQQWFESGFLQERSHAFLEWLSANRGAHREDWARTAISASEAVKAKGQMEIGRWAAHRIPEWLDRLRGKDVLEIVRRLQRG